MGSITWASCTRRAAPRSRLNRRAGAAGRGRGQAGYTLLEILLSVMLTAVLVSAVFGVALTAKTSGGAAERKVVAGLAQRQLTSQLGNYVTAYWDYGTGTWLGGTPPNNPTDIAGPSSLVPGAASWYLSGAGGSTVEDDCGTGVYPTSCYALQTGTHRLKRYLPAWFEAGPYNAQISYVVTPTANFGTAGESPTIQVKVNWNEP